MECSVKVKAVYKARWGLLGGYLRSNASKLMMKVIVQYSEWNGHGFGDARTNDGRRFKVQF